MLALGMIEQPRHAKLEILHSAKHRSLSVANQRKRLSRSGRAQAGGASRHRKPDRAHALRCVEAGGELGIDDGSRGRATTSASPPAKGAFRRSWPLPPRSLGDSAASGRAHPNRPPRPRSEAGCASPGSRTAGSERIVTRGVSSPGRRSSSTVSRAQLPALAALRPARRPHRRSRWRRTGPECRTGSPSDSGGPAPKFASAHPRPAPP